MKFIAFAAAFTFALASGALAAQGKAEMAAPPACDGQRFVFTTGEAPHATRVTLCSVKGATDADLVKMFDSAVAALAKSAKMAPEKRMDLIAQIKLKADQYRPAGSAPTAVQEVPAAPAIVEAPKPAKPSRVEAPVEYTSLPPLPPPLPPGSTSAGTSAVLSGATAISASSPRMPLLPKPRLTIECMNVEDLGGAAPCSTLERETEVVVRADEAIPAETALRFVRRGDTRAEVELAQLSRGKTVRLALPDEVCAGVNNSRVEIQVVRRAGANTAGQVVDSLGPYLLHC